jgi:hypothetical protein
MDNKATALKWYKQAVHDIDLAEKNIQIKGYDVLERENENEGE